MRCISILLILRARTGKVQAQLQENPSDVLPGDILSGVTVAALVSSPAEVTAAVSSLADVMTAAVVPSLDDVIPTVIVSSLADVMTAAVVPSLDDVITAVVMSSLADVFNTPAAVPSLDDVIGAVVVSSLAEVFMTAAVDSSPEEDRMLPVAVRSWEHWSGNLEKDGMGMGGWWG